MSNIQGSINSAIKDMAVAGIAAKIAFQEHGEKAATVQLKKDIGKNSTDKDVENLRSNFEEASGKPQTRRSTAKMVKKSRQAGLKGDIDPNAPITASTSGSSTVFTPGIKSPRYGILRRRTFDSKRAIRDEAEQFEMHLKSKQTTKRFIYTKPTKINNYVDIGTIRLNEPKVKEDIDNDNIRNKYNK